MNLFVKIPKGNLDDYRKEFIECLKHNSTNSNIKGIFVYTDQIDHKIEPIYKTKVFFKRNLPTDIEMISYSKSTRENKIIYSDPFVKFEEDLYKVTDEELDNYVIKGKNYFIFSKKTNLILTGPKELKFEKIEKHKQLKTNTIDTKDIRTITRIDNLVKNNSNILVKKSVYVPPKTNPTKRSKKLNVIIVSVDYNDYLVLTLEQNLKIFNNITVVTSEDDNLCQEICRKYEVNCVVTDVMYEDGAQFNKGKAINEGIKSITNPDIILLLDADIIVEKQIDLDILSDEVLYTSERIIFLNYNSYKKYVDDRQIGKLKLQNDKGYGFFQLFCINNSFIDLNCPFPENSNDASYSDLEFRDKFHNRQTISHPCLHLGEPFRNWKGRLTEKFITESEFDSILYKKSTFTICSFYFNYNNDPRQKVNFIKFLEQWGDYYDDMIVGIIDYGDINFEIPCRKIVIKGDINKRVWSKEILINKIVEQIDTDYILWIDGDIIYDNLDWIQNIDNVAKDNDFVQLFETINYLGENSQILETHKCLLSSGGKIDILLGKGYKPGGAWLGKTSILKKHKLFEKMYVGGGDTIFTYGLFSETNGKTLELIKEANIEIYQEALNWINEFGKYKFGYLKEDVNHLFHGDLSDRDYNERYSNLKDKEDIDVTILILAHKPSEYLDKCILSAKNQKFDGKIEILLTSDSCPELSYVEDTYNIRFTLANKSIKNSSCSFNFNHGIKESNGKYIKILAYDDFLLEDTIQNLYEKIKTDEFSLIHANCYEIYENQIKKFIPEVQNVTIENLLVKNQIHGGTIIFNKEDFLQTKGLNETLVYAEEYDFYFKLLSIGKKIGYLDKFVYNYRRHSGQKGTLSLTNEEKINKSKIVEKIKNNYRRKKIVCGIATIYERRNSLRKAINSIIDQVDEIFVYQNGYYEVFDFLIETKIKVVSSIHTGIDKGDAGKFYNVENIKDSYYFSIDDDLIYPSNYVENTISELKKLNNESVVSYHGKTYSKKATSYYKEISQNYKCLKDVNESKEIEFPGTGVMCFHTDYLKLKFDDFEYPNMADVFLGIFIKNQNKKCIVLKHKEGWIQHDEINLDNSLFVVNKSNEKINEVFNRRNLPKFCIVTTMWQRHKLTNFVFSYYKKLKLELKNEINIILISCGSECDISRRISEENGFDYIEFNNFPLSKKHNQIFIKSKEFEPDGVVLIGSDDFLSKEIILTYKNLIKEYEYMGIKNFYLLNEKSEFRFWPGYENERVGEPIGGGRFYRKDFLEKLNWQPWGTSEINKSLDNAFTMQIKNLDIKSKVIECSEKNGIIFTMRSSTNITKMNNIGHLAEPDIITKKICNYYELLKLQKEI